MASSVATAGELGMFGMSGLAVFIKRSHLSLRNHLSGVNSDAHRALQRDESLMREFLPHVLSCRVAKTVLVET